MPTSLAVTSGDGHPTGQFWDRFLAKHEPPQRNTIQILNVAPSRKGLGEKTGRHVHQDYRKETADEESVREQLPV